MMSPVAYAERHGCVHQSCSLLPLRPSREIDKTCHRPSLIYHSRRPLFVSIIFTRRRSSVNNWTGG